MCIRRGKMNTCALDLERKKRWAFVGIITKHHLKPATRATEGFGRSKSRTLSGVIEKIAATLRLGGGGAAAWCGPGRECGRGFWAIFGGHLDLWRRKRREDAGSGSRMITGDVRDACGALARETELPGAQNLQKSPKIRGRQAIPLLCLSGPRCRD